MKTMNWHENQNILQVKKWKFSVGGIAVSTAAFQKKKKKKVQNCIYDAMDRPSV